MNFSAELLYLEDLLSHGVKAYRYTRIKCCKTPKVKQLFPQIKYR